MNGGVLYFFLMLKISTIWHRVVLLGLEAFTEITAKRAAALY
jgi:hypothetical protein